MPTPSQTSVANAALRILGAKRIASIDAIERNAKVLKDAYDDALEETLGRMPWKFANERVELPALAASPVFDLANAYQLPADSVMPREVFDEGRQGWRIEGTQIVTNIGAPLKLIYTKRVTDMTVWHALARKALAAQLAIECAETITGTRAKVEAAYTIRRDAENRAFPTDGQQDSPRQVEASSWDFARGVQGPMRFPPDDTSEPL